MSAAKHNRPARARRLPSVKRSILTSFLLFTLIAVTLFWLCTAVFLDDIYRAFKRGEIRSASAQIEQKLLRDDWETAADAVAERNNCCAIVYQMYGDSDGLELLSAEHLSDCAIHRIDRVGRYGLFRTAQDAGGSFLACYRYDSSLGAYRIEQDGEEKSADTTLNLISARIVQKNGSIYFILLNSAVTPVNTAVKTIMALLAAITLILLLLSALLACGTDEDSALALCIEQTRHKKLHEALEKCREETQMGVGIATAFAHQKILPAMYGKMLLGGAQSGELVQVTENLARRTAQEAENGLCSVIDRTEPILIGFLTASVGLTLLSVMLPLLGILSAI